MTSSLVKVFILYRYLSTSQGAGNGTPATRGRSHIDNVQLTIYLARGRKHIPLKDFLSVFIQIAPYSPREGPETQGSCKSRQKPNHLYSSLSTSRGAGNKISLITSYFSAWYSYLSTSRGAGNEGFDTALNPITAYSSLSTSRGAGNKVEVVSTTLASATVQIPIYLERGRKRS